MHQFSLQPPASSTEFPSQTLLLGVGNLLLSDEGVGIHVIEHLQAAYSIPAWLQIMDGGTLGLDLLAYLAGIERLILVDAVETGGPPGTIIRLENEAVPIFLARHLSPHQIGIPDMLYAARLRDLAPAQLVLWGMQPASLEIGLELSPAVAARFEAFVTAVAQELGLAQVGELHHR